MGLLSQNLVASVHGQRFRPLAVHGVPQYLFLGLCMTISILLPFMPTDGKQILPFTNLVQEGSAERLWTGQSLLLEPHTALAYASGAGGSVPMGTSVTLMPLRHPFQAALQARSLAALSEHPFIAGLGTGPQPFVQALCGSSYASPLGAVREYTTIVRCLLNGETVDLSGDYYGMHGALPPLEAPPVQLGLGVLRPKMAELAGEISDVAITWMSPPDYLARILLPALTRGAERAQRPRPRVTAVVHVSLDAPRRDHARVILAAARAHLQAPHYQAMLRLAGVEVDPHDLLSTAERLIESGTVAVGSVEDVLRTVRAYYAAGADEIVLNTIGLQTVNGTAASLSALDAVTRAVRAESAAVVEGRA
ncbi:LLM class flavin-dependent oxidoreductase [Streptomyces sp. NBC_01185]|uniref:LLM class flavin-dependent oxidoreductase n=1 Tax=Streptomyces sp. NBC_01185 TaxID=2903764 RepID=UPI00386634F7|nr:LLM class flavin-dependent oxidoreductase [Streptomyces sp. NBC_01185]